MGSKRKNYSAKFKLQVVLDLLSWQKTYSEITSEYSVHATQVSKRKQEFQENAEGIFEDKRKKDTRDKDKDKVIDWLYKKIGQLTYERDWLEKKIGTFPDIFWKG